MEWSMLIPLRPCVRVVGIKHAELLTEDPKNLIRVVATEAYLEPFQKSLLHQFVHIDAKLHAAEALGISAPFLEDHVARTVFHRLPPIDNATAIRDVLIHLVFRLETIRKDEKRAGLWPPIECPVGDLFRLTLFSERFVLNNIALGPHRF